MLEVVFTTIMIMMVESFFVTICKFYQIEKKTNMVCEAVSHSRFGIFMFANMITGILFLMCDSLTLSAGLSVLLVIGYMSTLIIVFGLLYILNIPVKFW